MDYAKDSAEALMLIEAIEARFSHAINKYVLVSAADTNGIIVAVSPAFCAISGYRSEELIGQPHSILRHVDMPRETFADLWRTIQAGDSWQGEIKNRTKEGGFFWMMTDIDPVLDARGSIIGYIAVWRAERSMREENQSEGPDGYFDMRTRLTSSVVLMHGIVMLT